MENREILIPYLRDICCLEERLADCRRDREVWEEKRRQCVSCLWGGYGPFLPPCREALGALAGLAGLCLGLALITAWLDLGYAASFFRIASAAFLVSFLGVLGGKLLEGKRAWDRQRPELESRLRRCEWELAGLDSREREICRLLEKLYSLDILPRDSRSLTAVSRLYRDLLTAQETETAELPVSREALTEAVNQADAFLNSYPHS